MVPRLLRLSPPLPDVCIVIGDSVQPAQQPQSVETSFSASGKVDPVGFESFTCAPQLIPSSGIDLLGAGFIPSIPTEQLLLLEIEEMNGQLRMLKELANDPKSSQIDCTFLLHSVQEARDRCAALEHELAKTKRYDSLHALAEPPPEKGARARRCCPIANQWGWIWYAWIGNYTYRWG